MRFVTSAAIIEPGTIVKAFNGTHIDGMSNEDVVGIHFEAVTVKHFPRGVSGIFPRLRSLSLIGTG